MSSETLQETLQETVLKRLSGTKRMAHGTKLLKLGGKDEKANN